MRVMGIHQFLVVMGMVTKIMTTAYFNNQLCEGDCDDDSHCEAGLICFQRNGLSPVPGCNGNVEMDHDYCVYPTLTKT